VATLSDPALLPEKEKEARVALEKAAEDPKYKKEAELWMRELPQLPADP